MLETVIATFILVSAVMVVFVMLDTSNRYALRVENQTLAASIARNTLARIHDWAWQMNSNIYNYDTPWSPYQNATFNDPNYPTFQVHTIAQPAGLTLLSPCSGIELPRAPNLKRMPTAVTPVKITVTWLSDPAASFSMMGFVGEPPRTFNANNPIVITPSTSQTLAHGATVTFQVAAYDSSGAQLQNLMFGWSVVPSTGNGMLLPGPDDGSSVQFQNQSRKADGTVIYTGGVCHVKVRAMLGGVEASAMSGDINL